jgi:hypothetical protein
MIATGPSIFHRGDETSVPPAGALIQASFKLFILSGKLINEG